MKKFNIIIPTDLKPRPKPHEESAAVILSKFFKSDVIFIDGKSYCTPDVSVKNVEWEIKSPEGSSDNNIQKNMREASHQSKNIVIDLRRSKLHQNRALGYINSYLSYPNKLERVLVITKSEKVLVIK